ncbi:MAG: SpoIIE family protein phosphatase [Candidatus Gracilibacteria bacterium]|jgi:serine phosphatase RsbU (regulator of sigma subunit)
MRFPIRQKLVVAISMLVILLFSLLAYLFISEKKVEMADDIYVNSLAFSKLTSPSIADNYDLYLAQNSFVYFNREIKGFFEQNRDVSKIDVISYDGKILYDSNEDKDKKYEGNPRYVVDSDMKDQLTSENISFKTLDGRIFYLKEDENKKTIFVDQNEKAISAPEKGTFIKYFMVPVTEKYAVSYEITYDNLNFRIALMAERIIYLAIFGIFLGMIFSFVMSRQITNPISKLVFGVNKIATGDFKTRVEIKTHDEIKFLGDAVNKMAEDLDASMEARLYKERVTSELKIATTIQKQLIPKDIPKIPGVDISAGIIPAEEIGGDMYDFIQINKDRLMFYLGDVTGHGVPAGIVSSIANALFYGYANEIDLKKIMVHVNKVLKAKTMTNMFMTLCLMEWNNFDKKFRYVSAGHEQIIHYKAKEKIAELKPAGGLALGMSPTIEPLLKVNNIDFQIGDYLVIYSDGIPEAWRNEKECYGMERFIAATQQFGNDLVTADALKEAFLADVEQFRNGYTQMDDITIIVVKRTV